MGLCGKKQKNCDPLNPADDINGDQWDHTGVDVQSRLVVSLVIGKRSKDSVNQVVADFAGRTRNVPPTLTTTDDCSTYAETLLEQYGQTVFPEKTGERGRPSKPFKQWPPNAVYATVNKTFGKGAVTAVNRKLVHGTKEDLVQSLDSSSCSEKINTSFVERQNGTDRSYNARKARKTYEYSKDIFVHIAVSWWVMFCYNFHHLHAGLRLCRSDGTYLHRTPAMAAGIELKPLTVRQIFSTQVVGFSPIISGSKLLEDCRFDCPPRRT